MTRDVDVSASFWPDLAAYVQGDRVQLQQLVLNLVSNAYEAMQDVAGAKNVSVTTVYGYDETVQLVVGDTGPGISAGQLERIFEPFFTTKENGLGLGLADLRPQDRARPTAARSSPTAGRARVLPSSGSCCRAPGGAGPPPAGRQTSTAGLG